MTSHLPDTATARTLLHDTQKWMRVASCVGLVVSVVMFVLRLTELYEAAVENTRGATMLLLQLVESPFAVLIHVSGLRQANRLRDFLRTVDERQYLAALVAQRWFLRFVGVLSLYGLVELAAEAMLH